MVVILDLQHLIRIIPKPVIARVKGWSVGGGNVLQLVCDLTIAADNAKLGAFRTQNVAMVSNNNVRGYLLAVTLLLYGKTVVWLNKRLTDDELEGQMRDAGVACCLKGDSLPADLLCNDPTNGKSRIIGFDELLTRLLILNLEARMTPCKLRRSRANSPTIRW